MSGDEIEQGENGEIGDAGQKYESGVEMGDEQWKKLVGSRDGRWCAGVVDLGGRKDCEQRICCWPRPLVDLTIVFGAHFPLIDLCFHFQNHTDYRLRCLNRINRFLIYGTWVDIFRYKNDFLVRI